VTAAIQEECIRITENRSYKNSQNRVVRPVYRVNDSVNFEAKPKIRPAQNSKVQSNEAAQRITKCYECNSTQHLYKDCPKKKNANDGRLQKPLILKVSRQ
jgi:hypothetical protein